MKGLGKILLFCMGISGALLLYVHERVEMLRVSYRIHNQSSRLSEKAEELRRLTFEVTQLRSSQNLEKRMEELSLPLTLPKEIQVLRVPSEISNPLLPKSLSVPSAPHKFFDFLGQWIQVAQARTDT